MVGKVFIFPQEKYLPKIAAQDDSPWGGGVGQGEVGDWNLSRNLVSKEQRKLV